MAAALLLLTPAVALAQPQQTEKTKPQAVKATTKAIRPKIQSQRWEEDWSVLREPAVARQPLDALKYMPLSSDPLVYLSLGANLRERVESLDAPQFGVGHQPSETYLLDRSEVDADLHVDGWESFVQLEDDRAVGKAFDGPADADRLDLEQAFIANVQTLEDGVLKLKLGRQEFGFDLQRFVSDRDGPNVRQAYDALWGDYEIGDWRIISFVSHPVQYQNLNIFDDYSNGNLVLAGFRVERRSLGPGTLAVYYLRYEREDGHFASASGKEQRNAFDMHYNGASGAIDFDLEAMAQQGTIDGRPLLAWAVGERSGYTIASAIWQPHFLLQFDAASGNTSASGTFGTFNPLFPNGSYFSLASLTGDANLIHLKPILTLSPSPTLLLQAAIGFQWRETTQDAIYTFPAQAIAGTAGHGGSWTGAYLQLDVAKQINANVTLSAEFVHFVVGATIQEAGGHNTDYGNLQLSLAW